MIGTLLPRPMNRPPLAVRLFGHLFVGEMLSEPAGASHRHPLFELTVPA
jgi:hypothetical protein